MAITGSSNGKTIKIAPTIIFLLLLGAAEQGSAFTCPDVYRSIFGCISYVRTGQFLSPGCCNGLKEVRGWVSTAGDCQQVCNCALTLYKSIPGVQPVFVNAALNKCSVNFGFQFSPSMQCSKIHCA